MTRDICPGLSPGVVLWGVRPTNPSPRWRWRANALADALVKSRWQRLPTKPGHGFVPSSDAVRLHGSDPGPQMLEVIVPEVAGLGWPEERYLVGRHEYERALEALSLTERAELASWLRSSNGGALWWLRRRDGALRVHRTNYWSSNRALYNALLILAAELLRHRPESVV